MLTIKAAIGTLQAVELPIQEKDVCNEYFLLLANDHFCAGGEGKYLFLNNLVNLVFSTNFNNCINFSGKDSCEGDSGGPFVNRRNSDYPWYQMGIVSFGAAQCGSAPGVFIRVSDHLDWISRQLEP